jgi:two-component system, NarL family, nitrate/nitrite response regulator NarL
MEPVIDRSGVSARMSSNPSDPYPTAATTIFVVAAHALVREGLRSVLHATPGLSVIAEAPDLGAAVEVVERVRPEVVLLDEAPRDERSREVVAEMRRMASPPSVLCLSRQANGNIEEVLCVPSDAGVGGLCSVLDSVLGGRCAACRLRPGCVAPRIAVALSPREKQVAVCVARGMSSKQIAGLLGIGLRTVNTYRESLARKIGSSSAAVLTRFVLEAKLD